MGELPRDKKADRQCHQTAIVTTQIISKETAAGRMFGGEQENFFRYISRL